MNLTKKHLIITGLIILILLLLLFIIGETSFKTTEITRYIPPAETQLAAIADFDSNLVAHYTFDDNVNDSAGSNNGTISGGPTYVEGKIGRALNFDGVNDTVNAGTGANITGAVTISAWVKKVSTVTVNSKIITMRGGVLGTPSTEQYALFFSVGTTPKFSVSNGTTRLFSIGTTNSAPNDVWNHIVGTYNGTDTTRLYINGVQVDTDTTAGFGSLNSTALGVGLGAFANGAAGWLNGSIDDVRIYNRALSIDEISQLYALGGGTAPSSAVVNGVCGSAAKNYSSSETFPGGAYCSGGTANPLTPSNPAQGGSSAWSCLGSSGGTTASCTATRSSPGAIINADQTAGGSGTYSVKQGGTGDFTTIQACANAVKAGGTCLVYPGTYPEHVSTKFGGTDDSHRITFKANGVVTMQGFQISHPYVTVDGFDITGYTSKYLGHITLMKGGDYCQILNNIIRDGAVDISGISFYLSGDHTTANNCLIRSNTLRNLNYTFLNINGANHTFENNTLEHFNNRDYMYVFGHGHVFRRNIFRDGNAVAGVGNHPDWAQTFGDNGIESYDMLFEENWIENIEAAMGQLDAGGGSRGIVGNIHNWTFRRNVFVNISGNMSLEIPSTTLESNTFYRAAYLQSGINISGSLTRGDSSNNRLKNNIFVSGGVYADVSGGGSGFYSFQGIHFTSEVIRHFVTSGDSTIADAINSDLVSNGYLFTGNGWLTAKAKALTDITQFVMGSAYEAYKPTVYDLLTKTVLMDTNSISTFSADYNFVAGSAAAGYPPRSATKCDPNGLSATYYRSFSFCEPHGINGGNPRFANESDPDGPDNIPFTLDDGLKPLPSSPLCGKGSGGTDIGVYSCDPNIVLASGGSAPSFPVNGSCSNTINICSSGDFSDVTDTQTNYLWQCVGRSNGTTASCSLPISQTNGTPGDFNSDGSVNAVDFSLMSGAWNTSNPTFDLNNDKTVNTLDFSIMATHWTG